MAQTKSSQPGGGGGSGSNPSRVGANREQSRRGIAVGAGGGGRSGGRGATTGGSGGPGGSAPLPMSARGRRPGNPLNFIRDVRSELRKVAWPTSRETVNLTVVVIALSIAVGVFLGGFDFAFQELFKKLLEITQPAGTL